MKRHAILTVAIAVMMLTAASVLPVAAQLTPDPNTVLLDPFNGTTQGQEWGTIGYAPSLPLLDQAVDLQTGDWVKYTVSSWYTGQGSGTGTIETWVYPRRYSIALGTLQWYNTSTSPASGYIGNLTIDVDGFLYWSPWRAITVPPAPPPTGSSLIPLNEWTHVAVTWDPTGTSLYVNGVLDGYSAGNWDPYLLQTTYIYLNGWGAADLGFVDEFRISSVARSEAEIRAYVLETMNTPPVADPNGPYLAEVSQPFTVDGTGSSDPDSDPLGYDWSFEGSDLSGATVNYLAPAIAGIYPVTLTVDDGFGGTDTASTYVVIYDPSAGFVTGGGWIESPAGAYAPDPSLTGKATFGFVSKYKKGASTPTGNAEFQFKAGDLNFHSSSYEWLLVTGSDDAKFKGVGTINGEGEYKFQIWAGDADPDTFRIKIWTEDGSGVETVVYDNGMDQAIGGGSIIVHTKK